MDRALLESFRIARQHAALDEHARFLDGFVAGMACLIEAYREGRINDEWISEARDHIALYREFSR